MEVKQIKTRKGSQRGESERGISWDFFETLNLTYGPKSSLLVIYFTFFQGKLSEVDYSNKFPPEKPSLQSIIVGIIYYLDLFRQ